MSRKRSLLLVFLLVVLVVLIWLLATRQPPSARPAMGESGQLAIATWNVRGYPEKAQELREWFSRQLQAMGPAVLCIQEIADQRKVDEFLWTERRFVKVAFSDSRDGQDNAIFVTSPVGLEDLPDPQGFQHPAQAAYVFSGGFDAVVITVHLSWTNVAKREEEKRLLAGVVRDMLAKDPDVIVVGDFNTKEQGIEELARETGLVVMIPKGQDGVGTTHAGNRYDHFLISRDLADEEAVRCEIRVFDSRELGVAKDVSDHLPVVAWFRTDEGCRDRK